METILGGKLARMGLGLSQAVFNMDGDAENIHNVLLKNFPVLESCEVYTLLHLAENSHSMVEIEGADSWMMVTYKSSLIKPSSTSDPFRRIPRRNT